MRRSTTKKILTTQTGSLPRPKPLLDLILAREKGEKVDDKSFDAAVVLLVARLRGQQDHGLLRWDEHLVGEDDVLMHAQRDVGHRGAHALDPAPPRVILPLTLQLARIAHRHLALLCRVDPRIGDLNLTRFDENIYTIEISHCEFHSTRSVHGRIDARDTDRFGRPRYKPDPNRLKILIDPDSDGR